MLTIKLNLFLFCRSLPTCLYPAPISRGVDCHIRPGSGRVESRRWSVSPDNRTATISFDSGVKLTGNVSANCSIIDWSNDSQWNFIPTPVAITDVHIIAMNHLDVGYNGIPELGLINNIMNIYFAEYFPLQ